MRYLITVLIIISVQSVSAQRTYDKFFVDYNYQVVDSAKAKYRKTVGYFERKNDMTPARVQYDILPNTPFLVIWYSDYWNGIKTTDSTFYPNGVLNKVRKFHYGDNYNTIKYDSLGIEISNTKKLKQDIAFLVNGKKVDTLDLFYNNFNNDSSYSHIVHFEIDGLIIPKYAIQNNLFGSALLSIIISEKGKVEHIKVLKRPHSCYDRYLSELKYHFPYVRPKIENGKAVKNEFILPLNFHLD